MPVPDESVTRRRVVVDGRVQGVGFRQACAEAARHHRVAGWVRNRRDGRVEAVFEAPPAPVAAMVDWGRSGPPAARVDRLDVQAEDPEHLSGVLVAATE